MAFLRPATEYHERALGRCPNAAFRLSSTQPSLMKETEQKQHRARCSQISW
ncbi:Uncharacterized protein DAT39_001770 [Clarias magur]|uniref:Uncharacterized protein n=1 Tax=Clarias magur TaxID=1594786 RepID=A0A8J4UWH8_CLAMG|nr:Uncharacterized protein DAT39_001770 [Clarias magur]